MIARIWKGLAKPECADDYIEYLRNDTMKKLEPLSGFRELKILHQNLNQGVEFLVMTIWDNMASIEQFAEDQINKAVVPAIVQEYMISYDLEVLHYKIET